MTIAEMKDVEKSYQDRFGNLNTIADPSLIFDPRFYELLQSAIDSGRALTRADIEREFPDVSWNY